MAEVFKETQQHRFAVLFAQLSHGFVEQRADFGPIHFGHCGVILHGGGLLFASATTDFAADGINGDMARGGVQPAQQGFVVLKFGSLPGDGGKDGLRHILRQDAVACHPQRNRIDEVGMAAHQFGKRRLIAVVGKLA